MDECRAALGLADSRTDRRCLQPGQPILIVYPAGRTPREVFGEVKLLLKSNYLVRLYLEDGATDAILLQSRGRVWRDLTNGVRAWVVEELSGPQLSRFLLYRDYSLSGAACRPLPVLNSLRASA